jgi:hypothetical protein
VSGVSRRFNLLKHLEYSESTTHGRLPILLRDSISEPAADEAGRTAASSTSPPTVFDQPNAELNEAAPAREDDTARLTQFVKSCKVFI